MHEWELIWSEKPKQCHIGKGWYEYCIDNGLKKGDKLSFEFDKYDGSFMLSLSRRKTVSVFGHSQYELAGIILIDVLSINFVYRVCY